MMLRSSVLETLARPLVGANDMVLTSCLNVGIVLFFNLDVIFEVVDCVAG